MTVKENLANLLVEKGVFESQAKAIIELAVPVLNKQASEINGTNGPAYTIQWENDSDNYPKVLYKVWFVTVMPIALKWIDENKPNAWFREIFVTK